VQATAGVNYVRAEMPAKHLPGKTVRLEGILPTVDVAEDAEGNILFPRQAGATAIWMFPGNVTRWLLMAEMALQGIRVLVEVDDNYTLPPPHLPDVHSGWQVGRDRSGCDNHSYAAHRKIVASDACHGVVVSTPRLAQVYERFGKPVYVCPNSVDLDDWPAPAHAPEGVLRIGWAGSASHAHDLADIRPALDWASRQPGVEVVVLGQLDPGVPHRSIPWTDSLAQYRRNVGELDVILCPIRPGPWADCKSDVKALEGVMAGACPVVSETEPFRPWLERTFVARRPKDYLKIVKHLVANPDEARSTWQSAYAYVTSERLITKTISCWREALEVNAIPTTA